MKGDERERRSTDFMFSVMMCKRLLWNNKFNIYKSVFGRNII